MEIGDERVDDTQVDHEPWHAVWSDRGTWAGQEERKAALAARIGATFGDRSFVAPTAAVICDELHVGERSYIAAGCQIRDHLTLGDDCTLNPHVTTAGRVTIGDGVRIASHAALYGFNHVFDDIDTPIWMQGTVEEGIVVEDDVWIGTHVVVCDGVTIGSHSVVGAGAVVTRDVPPYSVVGGVPARVIRDRRDAAGGRAARSPRSSGALDRFDERVAEQWPDVLDRQRTTDGHGEPTFVDRAGAPLTTRAPCDAIEIAAAFGEVQVAGDPERWIERLQQVQDPATGLFPDPAEGVPDDPLAWRLGAEYHHYGVLSVGYALEVLGAAPLHPVRVVEDLPSDELVVRLDDLPWATLAWPAGSWVDFVGTAVHLNRRHHGSSRAWEALFGWLELRLDRMSGVWGPPDRSWGWLMPVNGFYRLTRGTYAQFGVPLPEPEAAIDTVLAHGRHWRWFEDRERNACNVLDVVHPLWLCAQQTDHRADEVRNIIGRLLERTVDQWVDGKGFAFDRTGDDEPGLQGSEMWLSIVHLAADHLGESDGLSWTPRGVHRLPPAGSLARPLG
jgi:acetyltransferase-like isoleucine patch superfamily enzyme